MIVINHIVRLSKLVWSESPISDNSFAICLPCSICQSPIGARKFAIGFNIKTGASMRICETCGKSAQEE